MAKKGVGPSHTAQARRELGSGASGSEIMARARRIAARQAGGRGGGGRGGGASSAGAGAVSYWKGKDKPKRMGGNYDLKGKYTGPREGYQGRGTYRADKAAWDAANPANP